MKAPLYVGTYVTELLLASLKNEPVTDFCSSGGFSFTPAVTAPLAAGATYTLTFTDCVNAVVSLAETINGTGTVTIDDVTGDPTTQDYKVQIYVRDMNVSIVQPGSDYTSLISGGMLFKKSTSTGGSTSLKAGSIDNPKTTLTYVETSHGKTRKEIVGPFSVLETISTSGAYGYGYGVSGDTATLTAAFPGNTGIDLTVTAVTPVNGTGQDAIPAGGSFTVTATDGSRLTAVISNGTVDLAVDSNGDGTAEGNVSESWDFFD
jgi:hypothetical protein